MKIKTMPDKADRMAKNTWIQTRHSRRVDPIVVCDGDMDRLSDSVCIDDIAHALSQKCRWTGHTREFYSIADHSYQVSRHAARIAVSSGLKCSTAALAGLMHDAAEAYLPDIASPIKDRFCIYDPNVPSITPFRDIESDLLRAIIDGLGLPSIIIDDPMYMDIVRRADRAVLLAEARDLMDGLDDWISDSDDDPMPNVISPMTSKESRIKFSELFRMLSIPYGRF